jgi:hypothetical protein
LDFPRFVIMSLRHPSAVKSLWRADFLIDLSAEVVRRVVVEAFFFAGALVIFFLERAIIINTPLMYIIP